MEPLKISAKNLGYTALADFCPRCYWIRLKTGFKLPWQTFPGIFSSIDAYTKHCVHYMIDRHDKYAGNDVSLLPPWMQELGDVVQWKLVPHWSKSKYYDEKSGVILTGAPDDIWETAEGKIILPDFKTAKHTDTQDKLFPMYEVQSNVYSILIDPHAELCLVYMEPATEPAAACENIVDCGFKLQFSGVVVPIVNDKKVVRKALTTTREIYDMDQAPEAREGCKECLALERVRALLR